MVETAKLNGTNHAKIFRVQMDRAKFLGRGYEIPI